MYCLRECMCVCDFFYVGMSVCFVLFTWLRLYVLCYLCGTECMFCAIYVGVSKSHVHAYTYLNMHAYLRLYKNST